MCVHIKLLQLCLTLCDLMDCSPPPVLQCSSVYAASLGKNYGLGCHALLQGFFPTQKSNTHVSCIGRQVLYH